MNSYQIASASIIGKSHQRMMYNNQDSCKVYQEDEWLVAVVCDGCGSSSSSEVGAKLTAEFIVNYCTQNFRTSEFNAESLKQALLGFYLQTTQQVLSSHATNFIKEHFYTTIVGSIVSKSGVYIFSAGDGVIVTDNEIEMINQQNRPQYIAYNITQQNEVDFKVRILPPGKISKLVIATDGLEDLLIEGQEKMVLEELFAKENFANEIMLSKYFSEQEGLYDDTTAVVIVLNNLKFKH